MTLAEAEFLFADKGELSNQEYFDEMLFEVKLTFTSKAPIRKVFMGKVERLQKLSEAFVVLEGELNSEESVVLPAVNLSDNVLDSFNAYYQIRNWIVHQITLTKSEKVLLQLVQFYLELVELYALMWKQFEPKKNEVIVSREPDPMMLLQAIKDFNGQGYSTFSEILKLEDSNPLVLESKRLTLLHQLNQDVG